MTASVAVEHLSKRYALAKAKTGRGRARESEVWALRDVSFSVSPGTILGVIGPNGAGKTTLLKTLSRVTLPTIGRAVVRGRVVSLLELGAGFHPDLSGRDNVFLNAALYGIPRAEVERRFDEIVAFAGLDDFIDAPVKRYSSGMYLRLAFSVAINMDPDILLADEILAVGDLSFQERSVRRVEEIGAANKTVLFVSHDMAAVRRLCNRVVWLSGGRLVEDGDPDAVVTRYEESVRAPIATEGQEAGAAGPPGAPISVRLVSAEGRQVGAVRVSEDVFVELLFPVGQAGSMARCSIELTTGGVIAFRAVQPKKLRAPQPGTYAARVRIPAHLLADTEYSVTANISLKEGGERRRLERRNAVSFRVYDTEQDSSARASSARKGGVVRPRLEWQVRPEPEPERRQTPIPAG